MEQFRSAPPQAVLYQRQDGATDTPRQALDAAHQTFARELGVQLSAFLRFGVVVKYEGTEEHDFAQFLSPRDAHRSAASITAQPFDSSLLLDLDSGLVYALIELMLGGRPGGGGSPGRAPTDIEKHLVAILMRTMTAELMRCWRTLAPAEFHFGGIVAGSQLARFFAPSDMMAAAKFNVAVGERNGTLVVLIPVRAADAFLAGVECTVSEDDGETPQEAGISRAMLDAQVRVDVWLDDVSMQLRDLVQLREGFVIKFDHPTDRHFACLLNGEPAFNGQVVSTGRKRAFLIQKETLTSLARTEI